MSRGRLTKQQKAQRTRFLNSKNTLPLTDEEKKTLTKIFSKKDLPIYFRESKMEIINHKAKKKVVVGAKDSGKTILAVMLALALIEEDKHAYILAARKYKSQSAEKFHTIFTNASLELSLIYNFKMSLYKRSLNKTIKMDNWKNPAKNQSIEYVSFDDPNGIAGTEAPNLGYYALVLIDEPVMLDDMGKIPERKEWKASLETIKDTIDRSKRRHKEVFKRDVEEPTYFLMMNLWDKNHPEVEDANKHISDQQLLAYATGVSNIMSKSAEWINQNWQTIWTNIKNNFILSVYNEATDTLYVKTTKLANPKINQVADQTIQQEVKLALLNQDNFQLARLLGMTYEGSAKNQKTYDLRHLEIADSFAKFKNENWKSVGLSVGWDIDINEALWQTNIILASKDHPDQINHPFETIEKIFVMPQKKIPAFGVGAIGENRTKTYMKAISYHTNQSLKDLQHITNDKKPKYGLFIIIDDNFQTWIDGIYELLKDKVNACYSRAKKHKNKKVALSYDINTRIALLQELIDKKFIVIDKKCHQLLRDLNQSVRKASGEGRDESSWKNKIYNTINSLEYALYPFRNRHKIVKMI